MDISDVLDQKTAALEAHRSQVMKTNIEGMSIVALARYLILDMKGMDPWKVVAIAVASLVLALTVLVIRYGHLKYPYDEPPEKGG